ncbi:hypothetical protein DZJ_49590 [Dickeya ananatis]
MKGMLFAAGLMTLMPIAQAADLTIGLASSTTSMDPQFYVGGANSAMARNLFDGLVNQNEKTTDCSCSGAIVESH